MYDGKLIETKLLQFLDGKSDGVFADLIEASTELINVQMAKFPHFSYAFDDIRQSVKMRLWSSLRKSAALARHSREDILFYFILKIREYVRYYICQHAGDSMTSCEVGADIVKEALLSYGARVGKDLLPEFMAWMEVENGSWGDVVRWLRGQGHPATRTISLAATSFRAMKSVMNFYEHTGDADVSRGRNSDPEIDLATREALHLAADNCSMMIDTCLTISRSRNHRQNARERILQHIEKKYGVCTRCWQWLDGDGCKCENKSK